MVSQVQPQEETEESLRKTKYLIPPGSQDSKHFTPLGGPTQKHSGGGGAGDVEEPGQCLGHDLQWGFQRKGRPGQGEQLRTGQFE